MRGGESVAAALEEITRQIKEETRVAILDQVKIIRDKESNTYKVHEALVNLETLLKVDDYFRQFR